MNFSLPMNQQSNKEPPLPNPLLHKFVEEREMERRDGFMGSMRESVLGILSLGAAPQAVHPICCSVLGVREDDSLLLNVSEFELRSVSCHWLERNFEEGYLSKMAYFHAQFGGFGEEFALYLAAAFLYHRCHWPV